MRFTAFWRILASTNIEHAADVKSVRIQFFGFVLIALTFAFVLIWAALAPLSSAVVVMGEVRLDMSRVTLQHREGGQLKDVFIRDGDFVHVGDRLIEIDDAGVRAEFDALVRLRESMLAKRARLKAERDGRTDLESPFGVVRSESEELALLSEHQSLLARKQSYETEVSIFREQINQINSQIDGLHSVNDRKISVKASIATELNDLERLVEREFISRHRLEQTARQLAFTESEIRQNLASLVNLSLQRKEIVKKIEFRMAEFRSKVIGELSDIDRQLTEMDGRISSLKDRLSRSVLKAPVSGQVIGMKYPMPGVVLPPGASVLDIVPLNEKIQIESQIGPEDIDSIKMGAVAEIRLNSVKAPIVPVINGTLVYLAGDRLVDDRSGRSFFPARVEVTSQDIKKLLNAGIELQPGLPVQVIIQTGEQTMLQYLIRPLSNAMATAFREK